jgi:hypothetical protein
MRIFRNTSPEFTRPSAAGGRGAGDVVCLIRRSLTRDVEVTGVDRSPAARAAFVGRRPRDPSEPWRETTMRVRLVREPDDVDDPNAIAVLTEAGLAVGYVDRTRAIRMAPVLDRFLQSLAAKREFAGCAVEVRCTAVAWAEWDPADAAQAEGTDVAQAEGTDVPAAIGMTLLVDDRDLGIKLAAPAIPALV